jgi:flavodoxin
MNLKDAILLKLNNVSRFNDTTYYYFDDILIIKPCEKENEEWYFNYHDFIFKADNNNYYYVTGIVAFHFSDGSRCLKIPIGFEDNLVNVTKEYERFLKINTIING